MALEVLGFGGTSPTRILRISTTCFAKVMLRVGWGREKPEQTCKYNAALAGLVRIANSSNQAAPRSFAST